MRNKIITLCAAAATAVSMQGCTADFKQFNNTGAPTVEQAEGDFFNIGTLFMSLQTNIVVLSTTNAYQFNENLTTQPYARYVTITKDAWNINNFCVFNAPRDWLNNTFNDQMSRVYAPWFKLKEYQGQDKVPAYAWAWAEILRVAAVQRTTDMYGPIPYSKIKENKGALAVAYDSQKAVYDGMFDDLNAAIAALKSYLSGSTSYTALSQYDLIYAGDFEKWLRFANSVKLRMAMRISFVEPDKAKAMALEALDPAGGGVIESNEDNATIISGTNPLWVMAGAYADTRAAADLTTHLNGYNDPRAQRYFKPVAKGSANTGKIAGMRVGITIPSHSWATENFSLPAAGEFDRTMILCAAEMAFAKAEAAGYHGWTLPTGESAEELYKKGVRLSFEQWSAGNAESYLADDTSHPAPYTDDTNNSAAAQSSITIRWDEAASRETKLERIMTQKWIALYPLGLEGWAEKRRTGYPRFFVVPNNRSSENGLQTRGASRIPFAPSEIETNAENYNKAVSEFLGGVDGYGVRLWWDVKSGKPGF